MDDNIYKKFIITDEQKNYLSSKDDLMSRLIEVIGEVNNFYIPDYFTALVNSIVFQAISFKAASTIWIRFTDLVGNINANSILAISDENMKSCGLSRSKVSYIKNIAKAFENNEIDLDFENMTNEEVIKELTKVKGIGNWTAQMFLIFCLYRKDVISYGDLAIRKGLEYLYRLDHDISKTEFDKIEKKFSPLNTIASLYLWEITLRNMFDTTL